MKMNLYFRSIQMGRGFRNKSRQMFWQLNKASLILGMEENLYIYVKACTHQDLSQQTLSNRLFYFTRFLIKLIAQLCIPMAILILD